MEIKSMGDLFAAIVLLIFLAFIAAWIGGKIGQKLGGYNSSCKDNENKEDCSKKENEEKEG